MVNWATELSGMSPAELHVWAVHDDARLELLTATVQAALSTLDQVKVRTLSQVLAEAVEDDAKLDLSALITRSLADLEPSHIRVLKAMCTETAPRGDSDEPIAQGTWLQSALEVRFPHLGEGILPIMATLEQHALVDGRGYAGTRRDGGADPAWNLTNYGSHVYAYLSRSSTALNQKG